MADRKSDFALPTLDDLFSTQEERDEARLEKIRDIPLDLIDDFPDHPFHVRDDEDMVQLVESIKTNGVLTPAVLRQKEDGRYEIVSGHRRKRACELDEDSQRDVVEQIDINDCTPSHDQTIRMRKMFESGKLTAEAVEAIMSEEKPNQRERIVLRGDRVRSLIPKNVQLKDTEDYVCKALEHYAKYLRHRSERDSR